MEASGQLLSGIVRVGAAHRGWKTPYEYAITWSSVDPDTVFLHGLVSDGGFTVAHKQAIQGHLAALGFRWAEWTRVHNGVSKPIRVPVRALSRLTGA